MPALCKIVGEVAERVIQMAKDGRNPSSIGKEIGVSKDTVKKFLNDNGIEFQKHINPERLQKYKDFIEYLKIAPTFTDARRKFGMDLTVAKRLAEENGFSDKIKARGELNRLTPQEVYSRCGDKLVEYDEKSGKYVVQTEDGFIYEKTSAKLRQGDPRGKRTDPLTEQQVSDRLSKIGYAYVLGTYSKYNEQVTVTCLKCGNTRSKRFSAFHRDDCPTCNNQGISKSETELKGWIESLGLVTEKYRFPGKTRGQEIDIFIPSIKIGIEYCGLYWHNETQKPADYHEQKLKKCQDDGIRLITIFEDEWLHRKNQVKNFLKSVFGINTLTIFARDTECQELPNTMAKKFLDDNHIQGSGKFKVVYGLFHKKELVAVMSGDLHPTHNNTGEFVLSRMAFLEGVRVVGGASKLLSRLMDYARVQGFRSIISWSDNRWSTGQVYSSIGFTKTHDLPKDNAYCDFKNYKRVQYRKKDLVKLGATGNTESEMASSLGLVKIWDCGKIKWSMSL